jgi:hypothetical protein
LRSDMLRASSFIAVSLRMAGLVWIIGALRRL